MIEFSEATAVLIATAIKTEREQYEAEVKAKFDREVAEELHRKRVREAAAVKWAEEQALATTPELIMGLLGELDVNQDVPDLIDGVVKQGTTVFVGYSGSGKTRLALQVGYCLLSGTRFLDAMHRPGQHVQQLGPEAKIGVLSYDMSLPLLANWINAFPEHDAPNRWMIVDAFTRGQPLLVPVMRAQMAKTMREANVEFVIVDSATASFPGDSENDATQVLNHYLDLQRFALNEVGAKGLLVIAHAGKASSTAIRGSSAAPGAVDSIMSVSFNEEDPLKIRRVASVKYREAIGQSAMAPGELTAPEADSGLIRWAVEAQPIDIEGDEPGAEFGAVD